MSDIKLNQDTYELEYVNDDFVFIDNTVDLLVQRLKIKLLTFLGEDVFDVNRGVPYFQIIFKKGTNKTNADSIFRTQIISTEGVARISDFQSELDTARREYTITKLVVIDEDNVPITINFDN